MSAVLVTGANRGLGLEFVRQYAGLGWRVFACCRNPTAAVELTDLATTYTGRISVHQLDVRDFDRVAALAAELAGQPIDLLLNNAGVYGPTRMALGRIDYTAWADVFAINTMAPVRLAECFVEHVAASPRRLIACVSSAMGSIAANSAGRHYLYRTTKAALNAAVKSLAVDLHDRGIIAVTLHPGWVKTDMGGPDADLPVSVSVQGVIGVLDRLTLADSGQFLGYDGSVIPW